MFPREGVRVVHTVRRTPRVVEQGGAPRHRRARAAGTPGRGAAARAPPGRAGLRTTRIPRRVPEAGADSGP
ncbi:hypothetical protein EIZ62_18670 [Streptomyces ficellus]|uniref:Uncharacterized protein n=1 Tax=Streptomyces ficellus TaxID=1977088 RepID=A0A6I6FF93_9ACTN|nr:hypothetical protein EIZ62_18670 [Streptomyces ficellus]